MPCPSYLDFRRQVCLELPSAATSKRSSPWHRPRCSGTALVMPIWIPVSFTWSAHVSCHTAGASSVPLHGLGGATHSALLLHDLDVGPRSLAGDLCRRSVPCSHPSTSSPDVRTWSSPAPFACARPKPSRLDQWHVCTQNRRIHLPCSFFFDLISRTTNGLLTVSLILAFRHLMSCRLPCSSRPCRVHFGKHLLPHHPVHLQLLALYGLAQDPARPP